MMRGGGALKGAPFYVSKAAKFYDGPNFESVWISSRQISQSTPKGLGRIGEQNHFNERPLKSTSCSKPKNLLFFNW